MPMSNPFARARYLLSAHTPRQLPPEGGLEVAFAGRSNAGKSSALNAICQQNGRRIFISSRAVGNQRLDRFEQLVIRGLVRRQPSARNNRQDFIAHGVAPRSRNQ